MAAWVREDMAASLASAVEALQQTVDDDAKDARNWAFAAAGVHSWSQSRRLTLTVMQAPSNTKSL